MPPSLVDRATSDALIGPDWAMNMDICDILNRDPGQAKDVVRGIKKRIRSKNPKVQLLALTLLETLIKNCGDIVHMHVAEKAILNEMVKIVKKKPDFRVKEKILVLVDTWQEAFGGPRARYPQYYIAYQELLHLGAVFPQRPEQSAPIFTPPQTQPLTSLSSPLPGPDLQRESDASGAPDLPLLSATEIKNARELMDVLSEMLNALDPGNKEGLKQEVIVDLVGQCRTYKQRVVHLVDKTSDEELINLGLVLNDDLQRVLAKHDAIAFGISVPKPPEKPTPPPPAEALVDIGDSQSTIQPAKKSDDGGTASSSKNSLFEQLALPAPPSSSSSGLSLMPVDLLSGDAFTTATPAAQNTLALVPVGSAAAEITASDQNILALSDMFAAAATTTPTTTNLNSAPDEALSSVSLAPGLPEAQLPLQTPFFQQQQPQQQQQQQQLGSFPSLSGPYYSNGESSTMNVTSPQYGQNPSFGNGPDSGSLNPSPSWNQSQAPAPQELGYVPSDQSGALPPPPWESQTAERSQAPPPVADYQPVMPMSMPVPMQMPMQMPMPMQAPSPQLTGFYGGPMGSGPQYPMPMAAVQYGGYGMQYYDQRMAAYGAAAEMSSSVYGGFSAYGGTAGSTRVSVGSGSASQPASRPARPEDKLFGDLVSFSKSKPSS